MTYCELDVLSLVTYP